MSDWDETCSQARCNKPQTEPKTEQKHHSHYVNSPASTARTEDLLTTAVTVLRVYMKQAKCQPELNRRTKNWLERNGLVVDEYVLKAGTAVKMNAGGLLHNSEAVVCRCGGVGGYHFEGYGSIPRCSTLGPMPGKLK